MIKINLVPVELIEKEIRQRKIILGITGVVIVISLMVLFLFVRLGVEQALASRQRFLEANLKKIEDKVAEVNILKTNKATLETKKNIIEGLMKERLYYPVFMEELVKILPNGVWLTSLSILSNPDGFRVMANCSAFDNFAVADLLTNLEKITKFSNVELGSISATSTGTSEVLQFQLKFNYSTKS
jgi:type IV pilus assembly protein PilN